MTADPVIPSEDPLSMESNPDELMNIEVLATMHRGIYLADPNAASPIWPRFIIVFVPFIEERRSAQRQH
jgi:hypothetical protein